MKQPKKITINQRTSSITNAFYASIVPYDEIDDEHLERRLVVLGYTKDELKNPNCIYCGEKAHTWDHLKGFIKDKVPSGYYHEINNLVPSCNTCNSSKGNKDYEVWLKGTSKRAKEINEVVKEEAIRRIESAIKEGAPKNILCHIDAALKSEMGVTYEKCRKEIIEKMNSSKKLSNELRNMIKEKVDNGKVRRK